ncbi:MAG: hypothetical protein HKN43_08735 [Rhodothermales bacterium]|nr:hypothetical protein [Rhodothermales bacterium]
MSNIAYNIIILAFLAALVTAGGIYVTFVKQPKEIEKLEQTEKVARLKEAEVSALIAEENTSSKAAKEAINKWRARYKVIPAKLTSADVVNFVNQRSLSGFKTFDIEVEGNTSTQDFRYYTLKLSGRGYYNSLYKFIWEVENHRDFYRIRDLQLDQMDLLTKDEETGNNKMQVMVSFKMKLDAYYGGASGLSAPIGDPMSEDEILPTSASNVDLPPVPSGVLPKSRPEINPFYPLILDEVPPNTYERLNMDEAVLVSIVGNEAIMQAGEAYFQLRVGDLVYLGEITRVDASDGLVAARLNRGGIIDEVELKLETGDNYRQALGSVRLAPVEPN